MRECARTVLVVDDDGNIIGVSGKPIIVSLSNDLSDVIGRVGILVGGSDLDNDNPIPVSDAGGNLSIDFGGTVAQLDDTDKLAVSVYGTDDEAGDTALRANAGGQLYVMQEDTFNKMLEELRIMNLHLTSITGMGIDREDVEA